MCADQSGLPSNAVPRGFATTHWSVVLTAGQRSSPAAGQALESLAQTYWFPLYAYVRRRGYSADDASDLTQEFFATLIEKNYVADASQDRGRFRSFLLTAIRHFLAKEWRKRTAQKRGGGRALLSLDVKTGESRYALEVSDAVQPEQLYERQWAVTVMEQVLSLLRDEYSGRGQQEQFGHLKPLLAKEYDARTAADVGESLGMTENSVLVAVHRMRRRYRELLRTVVAHTVSDSADVEEEILSLFRAVES